MTPRKLKAIIPLVAALVSLVAFTSSGGSAAAATSVLIDPGTLIDAACLKADADETLWLGSAVSSVSADSESLGWDLYDGAGYASSYRRCESFVVDLEVSARGYPQQSFSINALNLTPWPTDNTFSALCDGRKEATFVYRKNPTQDDYTLVAKKVRKGTFSAGACLMQTVSWGGSFVFPPPQGSAGDTYRILTRASAHFATNWADLGFLAWHRLVVASHLST